MVEIAGFSLKNRNPDVLTSIANLSNDEVFTPPSFANQVLDTVEEAWAKNNNGASIWEDKTVTFLDPFTKSGVFLREITRRLSKGLEKEIPDVQERVNHILTKQVFGVAITQLTALLARRSVYCSKYANGKHSICTDFDTPEGNIWFERTEHTWVGGKEKVLTVDDDGNEIEKTLDGSCKYCGAKQREYERGLEAESHAYALIHTDDPKTWIKSTFGEEMQFDVIVGNPPYQLSDGGVQGSASPIYQDFVTQAQSLEPSFLTMVIPSRWFVGGKGLEQFRSMMLSDKRLRYLADFPDSRDGFSGVDVAGGICYFLWDRNKPGPCNVETFVGGKGFLEQRDLKEFDTFVRDHRAVSVVRKVRAAGLPVFSELVHTQKSFGLRSFYVPSDVGEVQVFASPKDGFARREEITKNSALVDQWKVLVSKAASEHAGQSAKDGTRKVLSRLEIMPPGSACTESYLVVGPVTSEFEAKNLEIYMRTRFFRFLLSVRLISQNISRDSFSFVPLIDLSEPVSDSKLFGQFQLSKEEIELIEATIRPMGLNDA